MRRLTALLCGLCLLTACHSAPSFETPVPVETSAPAPIGTPAPTRPTVETPVPAPTPAAEDGVPPAVRAAAEAHAAAELERWSGNSGAYLYVGSLPYPDGTPSILYDSWRIDALEPAWEYRGLEGCDVDVYFLDYRLHTAAPDGVLLAGGMELDGEGWLFPGYATYLCFDASGEEPVYRFHLQENDCTPGSELFTGDLAEALRVRVLRQPPSSLAMEAQDYLQRGTDSLYRVTGLAYAGEYRGDGFTLTAYAAAVEWSSGGGGWSPAWLGNDGDAYVFQGRREGSVWVADVRAVPHGDLERAAVEALYHLDGLETSFLAEDGPPPRFGLGSDFPCPLGEPTATEVSEFVFAPDQAEVRTETYDGVTLTRVAPLSKETGKEPQTAPAKGPGVVSALTVTRPDWSLPSGVRAGGSRETVAAAYPHAEWDGDTLYFDPEPDAPGPYEIVFTFQGDTLAQIDVTKIVD